MEAARLIAAERTTARRGEREREREILLLFQVVESAVAFLLPFTHELFLEKRRRALGQRARRVYSRFIQSPVRSFDIFGKDIFLVTKPARRKVAALDEARILSIDQRRYILPT